MDTQETIKWLKAISATQTESVHKNSISERKDALHTAIYQVRIVEYLKTEHPEIYSKILDEMAMDR